MSKIKEDEIEVVIMNPEAIPRAQEKLFDFFYERYINELSKEDKDKLVQKNKFN